MTMDSAMDPLKAFSDRLVTLTAHAERSIVALVGARGPSSGTAVRSADGKTLVATVAHVMGARNEGQVQLHDGSVVNAVIRGLDPATDLALLEVEAEVEVPTWVSELPKPGQLALAVGRGTGTTEVNFGVISAVGSSYNTRRAGRIDARVEVDTVLGRGSSGGPLIDVDGGVLGLNTHAVVRGGTTLPTKTVLRVMEQLETRGNVGRGWLGVGVAPARVPSELVEDVGQATGVLVHSLAEDGPGAKGGLLLGDLVLKVDEGAIASFEDLAVCLVGRAEQDVKLTVLRAGEAKVLELRTGLRPSRRRAG